MLPAWEEKDYSGLIVYSIILLATFVGAPVQCGDAGGHGARGGLCGEEVLPIKVKSR